MNSRSRSGLEIKQSRDLFVEDPADGPRMLPTLLLHPLRPGTYMHPEADQLDRDHGSMKSMVDMYAISHWFKSERMGRSNTPCFLISNPASG